MDLVNIIWNLYLNNEGQLNYPLIAITISIVGLICTLLWYYYNSRRKLRIETSYTAAIPQNAVSREFYQTIPLFSVYITNPSKRNIYIDRIIIKLSTKINGFDEFYSLNVNSPETFPISIDSLEKYKYEINMESLNERVFRNSSQIKFFKVVVSDTLNKKYKSRKIKIEEFVNKMNSLKNA